MKHYLIIFLLLITSCSSRKEQLSEEYQSVLEAIIIKQRDELYKRGYATDDSVCIGKKDFDLTKSFCEELYLKKDKQQ